MSLRNYPELRGLSTLIETQERNLVHSDRSPSVDLTPEWI
jgi:hypothetical protein